jgi:hypothetical protein
MKVVFAIIILAVAALAGWIVYAATDSQTSAYIVSVAGSATGLAFLFVSFFRRGRSVNSTVEVGKAKNSVVKGVSYSGSDSMPDVKSELKVNEIQGGRATGIDWKKNHN